MDMTDNVTPYTTEALLQLARDGLADLVGFVQLLRTRDDLPSELYLMMHHGHRMDSAERALAALDAELTRAVPAAKCPHGFPMLVQCTMPDCPGATPWPRLVRKFGFDQFGKIATTGTHANIDALNRAVPVTPQSPSAPSQSGEVAQPIFWMVEKSFGGMPFWFTGDTGMRSIIHAFTPDATQAVHYPTERAAQHARGELHNDNLFRTISSEIHVTEHAWASPPEVPQLQGELARLRGENERYRSQCNGAAQLQAERDQLAALQANISAKFWRQAAWEMFTPHWIPATADRLEERARELAAIAQESQQG